MATNWFEGNLILGGLVGQQNKLTQAIASNNDPYAANFWIGGI